MPSQNILATIETPGMAIWQNMFFMFWESGWKKMSVKLRITAIRLYDKCQKNPIYSKKIGLTAAISSNSGIIDNKSYSKESNHMKQTY